MEPLPIRLPPGEDLRRALDSAVAARGWPAAFVLAGIGSLSVARLRFAGQDAAQTLEGALEILSLSGTLSAAGSHLHASVADAEGRVFGGHVAFGCTIRTTAEVLLALLPAWSFTREPDALTGYPELVARRPTPSP